MQRQVRQLEGQVAQPPIAPTTRIAHDRYFRLLRTYLEELGGEADQYFRTDRTATTISVPVWQHFVAWFVGRGAARERHEVDVVRQKTVEQAFFSTLSALRRLTSTLQLDAFATAQVKTYIRTTLTQQLSLSTQIRVKLTGTPIDLEAVLWAAASEKISYHGAEELTAFSMAIKCLVFLCCRPGELVKSFGYEDALRWRDIELFAVTLPDQRITLAARVKIRLLKGHRHNDGKFKMLVLRLLPDAPMLCPIVDLLTLADLGGVLRNTTATELLRRIRQPSLRPAGSRFKIALRADRGEQFVFRRFEGDLNGARAGDQPWDLKWLNEHCRAVGLPAGFIGRLTTYVWRRMGFNAINDPSVTVADRDRIMGHAPNTRVYEAYMSSALHLAVRRLLFTQKQ